MKELDLVKFVKRQRLQRFASLAILNPRQRFLVNQMATQLIHESSDLDNSTSEDEQREKFDKAETRKHVKAIVGCNTSVDNRLVNLFILQRRRKELIDLKQSQMLKSADEPKP